MWLKIWFSALEAVEGEVNFSSQEKHNLDENILPTVEIQTRTPGLLLLTRRRRYTKPLQHEGGLNGSYPKITGYFVVVSAVVVVVVVVKCQEVSLKYKSATH